jgi:hypothetical protein
MAHCSAHVAYKGEAVPSGSAPSVKSLIGKLPPAAPAKALPTAQAGGASRLDTLASTFHLPLPQELDGMFNASAVAKKEQRTLSPGQAMRQVRAAPSCAVLESVLAITTDSAASLVRPTERCSTFSVQQIIAPYKVLLQITAPGAKAAVHVLPAFQDSDKPEELSNAEWATVMQYRCNKDRSSCCWTHL